MTDMTPKTKARDQELAQRLENRDRTKDNWQDGAALHQLEALVRERDRLDAEIDDAVAAARKAGHSWNSIGLMLGTSKQAAQQRFG
jgi:hypothetical protein